MYVLLDVYMTKCINVKVAKFWMARNRKNELVLCRRDRVMLNIKFIDPKHGESWGYQPGDHLAVIFSPGDGMVATVDMCNDDHWKILFKQPEYYDDSGIPTNASIFKLTGVDERIRFLWFRSIGGERLLRYGGIFNRLSFSKKHNKAAAMNVVNLYL